MIEENLFNVESFRSLFQLLWITTTAATSFRIKNVVAKARKTLTPRSAITTFKIFHHNFDEVKVSEEFIDSFNFLYL